MADNLMIKVDESLSITELAEQLAGIYRNKGFSVVVTNLKNGASTLVFDKGVGGINLLLGMGLGITATMTRNNGMLAVIYSDAEWMGKVIGLGVGWFLCLVPFLTAIVGSVKQLGLAKEINKDITMLANQM